MKDVADLGFTEAQVGASADQQEVRPQGHGLQRGRGSPVRTGVQFGGPLGLGGFQNAKQLLIAAAKKQRMNPGQGQAIRLQNANRTGLKIVTLRKAPSAGGSINPRVR